MFIQLESYYYGCLSRTCWGRAQQIPAGVMGWGLGHQLCACLTVITTSHRLLGTPTAGFDVCQVILPRRF